MVRTKNGVIGYLTEAQRLQKKLAKITTGRNNYPVMEVVVTSLCVEVDIWVWRDHELQKDEHRYYAFRTFLSKEDNERAMLDLRNAVRELMDYDWERAERRFEERSSHE